MACRRLRRRRAATLVVACSVLVIVGLLGTAGAQYLEQVEARCVSAALEEARANKAKDFFRRVCSGSYEVTTTS